MGINCFPPILLWVLMSSVLEVWMTDGPDIKFNERLEGVTIRTLLGVSIEQCWENCEQRMSCMSINYHRQTHLCHLNSDSQDKTRKRQPGYVFRKKPEVTSLVKCGLEDCNDGEACKIETEQCKIKECKHPQVTDEMNIEVEGNLLATGSEKKMECKPGFSPLRGNSFSVTSVCQMGKWSTLLECIPLTCKRLAEAGITISKMYKSFDEGSKETIDIFCEFDVNNRNGYTFLAPGTINPNIAISNYYTRPDRVNLRHVSDDGHFESKIEVLPLYRDQYNVSIFISKHPDFNPPIQVTPPYMYMGFVPISFGNHIGKTMGYSCNGVDYTFKNSDGNPNNFFTIFESPSQKRCWGSGGVSDGWKLSSTPVSATLPEAFFFDWYEIHMGGGGCLVRNCVGSVKGMAFGLPFDY